MMSTDSVSFAGTHTVPQETPQPPYLMEDAVLIFLLPVLLPQPLRLALMVHACSQSLLISPCITLLYKFPPVFLSTYISFLLRVTLPSIIVFASSFGQQYHYQTIDTITLFTILLSEPFHPIQNRGDRITTGKLNCKVILWQLMHVLKVAGAESQWPWLLFCLSGTRGQTAVCWWALPLPDRAHTPSLHLVSLFPSLLYICSWSPQKARSIRRTLTVTTSFLHESIVFLSNLSFKCPPSNLLPLTSISVQLLLCWHMNKLIIASF